MKFVVIGASGLVGSHVWQLGSKTGLDVVGTTRSADSSMLRQLDVADEVALTKLLESEKPDAVVYTAGFTWADGCEKDPSRSRLENYHYPLRVAKWCQARGVRLLYYSTAYVFNGHLGNYIETDIVSPINVYGSDKADVEKAILDVTGGNALVARLMCVWGQEVAQKNFLYQVLRAVDTGAEMVMPSDQRGNPTWAGDIAEWTLKLIEKRQSGIWHLAGPYPQMTRLDWAHSIVGGLSQVGRPVKLNAKACATKHLGQIASRPLFAGMNTSKAQSFHPISCRNPDDLVGVISNIKI